MEQLTNVARFLFVVLLVQDTSLAINATLPRILLALHIQAQLQEAIDSFFGDLGRSFACRRGNTQTYAVRSGVTSARLQAIRIHCMQLVTGHLIAILIM